MAISASWTRARTATINESLRQLYSVNYELKCPTICYGIVQLSGGFQQSANINV